MEYTQIEESTQMTQMTQMETQIEESSNKNTQLEHKSNWDRVFEISSRPLPVLDTSVVFNDNMSAKDKFEAFAVQQMALTCMSKEFQVVFTQAVAEDVALCKRQINNNSVVMENVRQTVDSIKGELHDLKKGLSEKSMEMDSVRKSEKYNNDDIGKVVWPLLPLLIDGLKGVCGWVPVNHVLQNGDVDKLVVLSVPLVQFLVRTYDGSQTLVGKIDNFLKSNLKRYRYGKKMKMSEFISIMLKTPFKPYVHTANCAHVAKGNIENYIIMEAEYFKGILEDINLHIPNRPKELPENFPDSRMNTNLMFQAWASEAQSPMDNRTPLIPVLRRRLSFEERKTCPPMLQTWWREAYGPGMIEFFGMDAESTNMGHVCSGSYVQNPSEIQVVQDFETFLQFDQIFVEEQSEEQSEEKDNDADVDDDSSNKKGKKRAVEDSVSESLPLNRKKNKRTKKKSSRSEV